MRASIRFSLEDRCPRVPSIGEESPTGQRVHAETMRRLGHLENRVLAERAGIVLGANGIPNRVEPEDGRQWSIWVMGEEDLERARQLFTAFLASPEDPRFRALPVATLQSTASGAGDRAGGGPEGGSGEGAHLGAEVGVSTIMWVILAVWVAAVTRLGEDAVGVGPLLISTGSRPVLGRWDLFLPEVQSGQAWRLITPVLLHFGWPHLLFNLWWFWGLGHAIERQRGTLALTGMVIGFGLVSNLGQYVEAGPHFGGLSGVVYGLVGYVWMLGRYRPSVGLALQPQVMLLMVVWFLMGVYGTMGVPVANTAHGVGLLAGLVWGRWSAARLK